MSNDTSCSTIIDYTDELLNETLCEVLQGRNKRGWVVELKFSEIQSKELADRLYKYLEGLYQRLTESADRSQPKIEEEGAR